MLKLALAVCVWHGATFPCLYSNTARDYKCEMIHAHHHGNLLVCVPLKRGHVVT